MMGNTKQQQDLECLTTATSPKTQAATQGTKRKRQLPNSLTQGTAAAVSSAATTPQKMSSQSSAATKSMASPAVPTAGYNPLADSKPRQRPRIQPPAASAAAASASTAVNRTAEPAGAEDQQHRTSAAHTEPTLAATGRIIRAAVPLASVATALAPSQAEDANARSSAAVSKHTLIEPARPCSNSETTAAAPADSHSWGWMLTAEQMLAATDEQLLQQCRHCLASAGGKFHPAEGRQQTQQPISDGSQQQRQQRQRHLVLTAGQTGLRVTTAGAEGDPVAVDAVQQQQQQQNCTQSMLNRLLELEGSPQLQQPQQPQQQQQQPPEELHQQALLAAVPSTAAAARGSTAVGSSAARPLMAGTSTSPRRGPESLFSRLLAED